MNPLQLFSPDEEETKKEDPIFGRPDKGIYLWGVDTGIRTTHEMLKSLIVQNSFLDREQFILRIMPFFSKNDILVASSKVSQQRLCSIAKDIDHKTPITPDKCYVISDGNLKSLGNKIRGRKINCVFIEPSVIIKYFETEFEKSLEVFDDIGKYLCKPEVKVKSSLFF